VWPTKSSSATALLSEGIHGTKAGQGSAAMEVVLLAVGETGQPTLRGSASQRGSKQCRLWTRCS
jgi:hypothetical protein